MMVIQSCLTIVFDGRFFRAVAERRDGKYYAVASVVLGSSAPSMPTILNLVNRHWQLFSFQQATSQQPRLVKHINPKRAQRLAQKAMKTVGISTKAQATLQRQLEQRKQQRHKRKAAHRKVCQETRYLQRVKKHREKHRGH